MLHELDGHDELPRESELDSVKLHATNDAQISWKRSGKKRHLKIWNLVEKNTIGSSSTEVAIAPETTLRELSGTVMSDCGRLVCSACSATSVLMEEEC